MNWDRYTETAKRREERMLFAYGLAKQICDFAETNNEVEEIIKDVKCVFLWYHAGQKPKIFKNPITAGGHEIVKEVSRSD